MLKLFGQKSNDPSRYSIRISSVWNMMFYWMWFASGIFKAAGLAAIIYGIWALAASDADRKLSVLILASGVIILGFAALTFILSLIYKLILNYVIESFSTEKTKDTPKPAPQAQSVSENQAEMNQLNLKMEKAVALLGELNENILLNDEAKKQKWEAITSTEVKEVLREVDKLVNGKEWAQARTLLGQILQKHPENTTIKEQVDKLKNLQKQAFNGELEQASKLIKDLIAISAWDKAIQQAENLLDKHPDNESAKRLVHQTYEERQKFRIQQIKRMHNDIERAITRKRWSDALQITRQMIEKYPDSPEAEELRARLATMEENAEIEKRQQLEEQIKDLVKRKNFIQAVELAKYIIHEYPQSPQADALKTQIEKLTELASKQEKELEI